jgi:hypothetical protein
MGVLSKVNVVNKIWKRRMVLSDSPFFHFPAKDESVGLESEGHKHKTRTRETFFT